MKRRLAAALGALLLLPSLAAAQLPARAYLLQHAATSTGGGNVAHAFGYTLATVQIVVPTGASPHAGVQFEQSLNDVHYTATLCTPLSGGPAHTGITFTPASVGTAALHWRCNVTGAFWFRARIIQYTGAGAVTVYGVLTAAGSHSAALLRPFFLARNVVNRMANVG